MTCVILSVVVFGCATDQHGSPGELGLNKTTGGALVGAAAGGLVGSTIGSGKGRLAATAAGVLLGAFAGGEVGKSLDRADQLAMTRATQSSLETAPSGRVVQWRNPDTGNHGTITPVRTYQDGERQFCREYQQTIVVGGRSQEGYGRACRQPDGSWRILHQ
jgi:surface antigen